MKRKWKLLLGSLVVIAGVAVLATQALQGNPADVIGVEPTVHSVTFTEDGRIRPEEALERTVYSAYSAPIAQLNVQEGDRISQGQTVAVLDDTEVQQNIREVQAGLHGVEGQRQQLGQGPGQGELKSVELSVEQAENAVETAERALERTEELHEAGLASTVELEEAEDSLKEAENHLEQQKNSRQVLEDSYRPAPGSYQVVEAERRALEAQRDLLQYRQSQYHLTAPISGVVAEVQVDEGSVVGPEVPVIRLFQEDNFRVETEVLDRDAAELEEGMTVGLTFETRNEDVEFEGEIEQIAPEAEVTVSPLGLEEERVAVTIRPFMPEDFQLAPGYRVEVEFVLQEEHNQLVVPLTALFTVDGEDALLVLENGRAAVRTVETGTETRTEVAIVSGLEEGDQVIVDPERDGVEEGERIEPQ